MVLLIDIGNTCAKLAIGNPATPEHEAEITYIERKPAKESWTSALRRLQHKFHFDECFISCVGKDAAAVVEALNKLPITPHWLTASTECALKNVPEGYGADRLAADIGALYLEDCEELLVIDAGTCITYDLVLNHTIASGVISPGAQLRLRAMNDYTALLPLIELYQVDEDYLKALPLMNNTTETCMLSSVVHGVRFEIEGYIRGLVQEYPNLRVFLTGGNHFEIAPDLKDRCTYSADLVLLGLLSLKK